MTIGLLDPALFLARDQKLLVAELDLVVLACRQFKIRLIPLKEYWPDLWTELGRSLETTLPPPARMALQELRKLGANYPASSVGKFQASCLGIPLLCKPEWSILTSYIFLLQYLG